MIANKVITKPATAELVYDKMMASSIVIAYNMNTLRWESRVQLCYYYEDAPDENGNAAKHFAYDDKNALIINSLRVSDILEQGVTVPEILYAFSYIEAALVKIVAEQDALLSSSSSGELGVSSSSSGELGVSSSSSGDLGASSSSSGDLGVSSSSSGE